MNRQPLLLLGAGLLTLSVCWVVVFAVTMQRVPPPVAILPSPLPSTGAPHSSDRVGTPPDNDVAAATSLAVDVPTPLPTLGPPLPTPSPSISNLCCQQTPAPSKPPRRTPPPEPTPLPTLLPLPTPDPIPTPAATQTPPPPTAPPLPAISIQCGNGADNSGGLGLICEITITPLGVSVRECHGAAGAPTAACSLMTYSGRVTSVDACNASINGGGGVLLCSVNGVGIGSASITLCIGTGAGGTLVGMTCTAPESSSVTVRLCNNSANGGGSLIRCRVEP